MLLQDPCIGFVIGRSSVQVRSSAPFFQELADQSIETCCTSAEHAIFSSRRLIASATTVGTRLDVTPLRLRDAGSLGSPCPGPRVRAGSWLSYRSTCLLNLFPVPHVPRAMRLKQTSLLVPHLDSISLRTQPCVLPVCYR